MNDSTVSLVHTNGKCQGCNRCISACPVLTANYQVGLEGRHRIEVHGENCIQCGACLEVCEHQARSFYDDTERFFEDLKRGVKMSVLLAPAFQANYPTEYASVLGGLKKLGVNHIISVSFGADITTWGYINYITANKLKGGISQPCPAVVNYIEHYVPELIDKLVPVHSPMMCAAIYAKKYMGIQDRLAFISPCIAKKAEITDPNTYGYVSYNLAFDHFMRYVRKNNVVGPDASDEIEYGLGSIYPMPGGLKENVYWFCGEEVFIRQVEGKKHAYDFLEDYRERVKQGEPLPFMVDILNCDKGCLYGTGIEPSKRKSEDTFYNIQDIKERSKKKRNGNPFSRRLSPGKRLKLLNKKFAGLKLEDFMRKYTDKSGIVSIRRPNEAELDKIFRSMNKLTKDDRMINCGACGYASCREMAEAIFNNCNEPKSCVHFIKSEIQTFSEQLEKSNREMIKRNRELSEFIGKDFDSLSRSISSVLKNNGSNAEESKAISGSMERIAEFCSKLDVSLDEIGKLLSSLEAGNTGITKIADETNILSLNASVEAARSGEAGKGFAVVARQIKELAGSSRELAEGSSRNQEKISAAIEKLMDEAQALTNAVSDISGRLSTLASNSHELTTEASAMKDVSDGVRNKLEALSNLADEGQQTAF